MFTMCQLWIESRNHDIAADNSRWISFRPINEIRLNLEICEWSQTENESKRNGKKRMGNRKHRIPLTIFDLAKGLFCCCCFFSQFLAPIHLKDIKDQQCSIQHIEARIDAHWRRKKRAKRYWARTNLNYQSQYWTDFFTIPSFEAWFYFERKTN